MGIGRHAAVCIPIRKDRLRCVIPVEQHTMDLKEHRAPIVYGQSEWIYRRTADCHVRGGKYGGRQRLKVHELLQERGYDCSLINARFVKPLDYEMLCAKRPAEHLLVVTMEENVLTGRFRLCCGSII